MSEAAAPGQLWHALLSEGPRGIQCTPRILCWLLFLGCRKLQLTKSKAVNNTDVARETLVLTQEAPD